MWKDFILGNGSKVVKKIEINGKVAFKRKSYTDTEFTICPFPTSWTTITTGTHYNATNNYGEWNILATNYAGSHYINLAFDTSTTTFWQSANYSDETTSYEVEIDLPENVFINPKQGRIISKNEGTTTYPAKLFGFNNSTGEWELLYTLTRSSSSHTQTFNIDNSVFYSKFKFAFHRYAGGASYKYNHLYDFIINSGTIRTKE